MKQKPSIQTSTGTFGPAGGRADGLKPGPPVLSPTRLACVSRMPTDVARNAAPSIPTVPPITVPATGNGTRT